MNKPKFTPGPWRNEDGVIHAGTNDHIAVMKAMPEWEDNATLIAAAPEMYKKLEYLADVFRFGCMKHTDRTEALEIEEILKKARGEK